MNFARRILWEHSGLVLVHWVYFCLSLSIPELFNRAPLLPNNFDQFFLLTDDNISTRKSELRDLRDSGVVLWVSPRSVSMDCDRYIRTAIVVPYQNHQSLKQIFNSSNIMCIAPFVLLLCPNGTEEMDMIPDIAPLFRLDSDVYWVCYEDQRLILIEIYSLKGQRIVQATGTAELNERALLDLTQQKWERRRNFHKIPIIATAADDEAYSDEVKFTGHHKQRVLDSGLAVDIYRIFQDYLNFTEVSVVGAYVTNDAGYSEATPMHIQLAKGISDISITLSSVGEFKAQVAQLVHSLPGSWLVAHFPTENEWSKRFLSRPFTNEVWLMMLVHTLAILIGMKLIRRIVGPSAIEKDFKSDILWTLSFLCVKGWPYWSKKTSVRIVLSISSVMGYLLQSGYNSFLISQLSVRLSPTVTLQDLVHRKFQFLLELDVDFPDYVEGNNNKKLTTIATLSEWRDFGPFIDGTTKNLATVTYPEFFYFSMHNHNLSVAEVCHAFSHIRISSTPNSNAMLVSRQSEFREVFNVLTLMLMEKGVSRRLFIKNKRVFPNCMNNSVGHVRQTMIELSLAFVILFAGALSSVVVFIAEYTLTNILCEHTYPRGSLVVSTVPSQIEDTGRSSASTHNCFARKTLIEA